VHVNLYVQKCDFICIASDEIRNPFLKFIKTLPFHLSVD